MEKYTLVVRPGWQRGRLLGWLARLAGSLGVIGVTMMAVALGIGRRRAREEAVKEAQKSPLSCSAGGLTGVTEKVPPLPSSLSHTGRRSRRSQSKRRLIVLLLESDPSERITRLR